MPNPEVLKDAFDKKELLGALRSLQRGDFSVRLPVDWKGADSKIADAFNAVVTLNQKMSKELLRISRVVGKEGRISERATLGDVGGAWEGWVESINTLIGDLVWPTSETARVIGAVANGDLSQSMAMELSKGSISRKEVLGFLKILQPCCPRR